jgi:hypothetical protein
MTRPTIDFAEFKSTLEKLLVYCSNNPTVGVLTAADEVMGHDSGNRAFQRTFGSPDFPVAGALGKAPGWHDMTGRPGDCPRSTP